MTPWDQLTVFGSDRDHALARTADPATSHAADGALRGREGRANEIRRGTHRHRALLCFRHRTATADEVHDATGIEGVWKRVSDLRNQELVEPTGHTRRSRQGREQEVLAITDAGRAALARLEASS